MRNRLASGVTLLALALTIGSCATQTPAPAQVRLTDSPADVAQCSPLGYVSTLADDGSRSEALVRKRALGLNGNTVLFTEYGAGVAYRCP